MTPSPLQAAPKFNPPPGSMSPVAQKVHTDLSTNPPPSSAQPCPSRLTTRLPLTLRSPPYLQAPPKFTGPPAAAPASSVKWDQSSSNSGILGRSVTIIDPSFHTLLGPGRLAMRSATDAALCSAHRLAGIIGWDFLDWIVAFAVGVGIAQLHAWWHGSFTEIVDMAGGA